MTRHLLTTEPKPKPNTKHSPIVDSHYCGVYHILCYWLYHTDGGSFEFTEYMPCTMLLAMPHRCVFPRVHGAYAIYYDLRYATQMRVPSGSRSIYVIYVYVMPHRCMFLRVH